MALAVVVGRMGRGGEETGAVTCYPQPGVMAAPWLTPHTNTINYDYTLMNCN